jgi:small-conductance mechanosensitive channel
LAEELANASEALARAHDDGLRAHLEEVRDRLRSIDSLLRKQEELAALTPKPAPDSPDRPAEVPASVFALNELHEAQAEAGQLRKWLAEALAASRDALSAAKEKLDEAEKERRRARSELEAEDEPTGRSQAERMLELRQLASRAARERVHLRTLEARIASREYEQLGDESDLEARIAQTRDAIARGAEAPSQGFAALTEQEGALRRKRETAERGLATVDLRLQAAQQRFSRQANPPADLLEEVGSLTATRDAIRQEISLLEAQIERLAEQRTIWRQWQSLLRGEVSREELASYKEEMAERIGGLEQAELYGRGQRSDLERRLEAIRARLAQLPPDARTRPVVEEQRAAVSQTLDAARAEASRLAADMRLSERVLEELRDRTGEIDLLEYVAGVVQAAWDVWSYEITTVDDRPITVGSVVLALLLAGAGLWAARHGSAFVGRVATERFKLDEGAAHALQTLSFYALLVSFTLLALRAVHFPLTAFTVLGGALAIGIGFGSQNVMNNFISGLILMLERPVRAGDVVEVDSNHGTIERIGARSTQIRSTDGRHMVVPNSFFLENNVVNWTLSDDLIRTSVLVGVIYGSPTRLVEELIRQAVDEDVQVLKQPEPVLLFDEFGDNSLNFEVHFWVRARSPMAMRKVQSRLRFRIDDLFREHGLVIAFPQRDVHLDSASPIEVRVVNGGGQPPEPKAG